MLSPSLLEYQATGPLVPGATETITVPGGSSRRHRLARASTWRRRVTSQFTVAPGSTLRLQQLLAELGYLPLTFTPASPLTSPTQEGNDQVGSFILALGRPAALARPRCGRPGTNNVITQGAVMNFENQNGLKTDGVAGPQVWTDLLADVQSGKGDASPWDYVLVSQSLPETATVYKDGVAVYSTPVNTGRAGRHHRERHLARLRPLHGDDHERHQPRRLPLRRPGHPVGELLPRRATLCTASSGPATAIPQSDGCVEMPIANAAVVFPLTPLGTLVTVQA